MSIQGSQSIMGSIDGKNYQNVVIQYRGFSDDLCGFILNYGAANKDSSSGIACKNEASTYYVLVQGSQSTALNPETIWPDLTSKLRVK